MAKSIKLPDYVEFSAVPVIRAAAEGKDLPRFSMVAYSGGRMRVAGFPHAVVVDLGGLDIPSQSVPIRLDHKSNQGVGHTTRIEAQDGQLIAEGLISRETSWARDVARSMTVIQREHLTGITFLARSGQSHDRRSLRIRTRRARLDVPSLRLARPTTPRLPSRNADSKKLFCKTPTTAATHPRAKGRARAAGQTKRLAHPTRPRHPSAPTHRKIHRRGHHRRLWMRKSHCRDERPRATVVP